MTAQGPVDGAGGHDQGSAPTGGPAGVAMVAGDPGTLPRSVLLRAPRLMARTGGPALVAIVSTAAVQSLLMYLDVQSGFSPAFLLSFAVSAVVTLMLYAVLTACALASVDGGASSEGSAPSPVLGRARAHVGLFAGWVIVQWLLILVVSVVNPLLIAVVAVLTPFLPLAAMDGHRNALGVNLRAIAQRPGRWLLTSVVLLVGGLVLFLLSVANTLFVKGTPAAALFWLAVGVVAWWVLTAWALIYRAVEAGPRGEHPG